jgi:myo-inositol-1-phosphate synthase
MDKGISGAIEPASAYFMKSPPVQMRDDDARVAVMDFADGNDPEALNSGE